MIRLILPTCLTIAVACAWPPAGVAAIDFQQDVQPLLRKHCYQCHDGGDRTADLRLDVRDRAIQGGESGARGIVAGDRAASEVYRRITAEDQAERMPPEGPGLSPAEIELIGRWIDGGANWPDELAGSELAPESHWAFQPVKRPEPPPLVDSSWVQTPVDPFVLEKIEQAKLQPSPRADRVTLVRRLYLDLLGLPPSIEQVDAFVRDERMDAYPRLVEQLLRSPHYGERWGRIWLDAARYADSDGYEKDKARFVWSYRDWVVNAFNRDLPYDQFVMEQLAGDLLPNATQDQRVATGFLRNSMINEEGGAHPEQFRMEAMFDRMDALGKSVLGLTVQCAQCHNHKYDPLSQAEYYQLFAFLNNDHEANMPVYTAQQMQQRAMVIEQIEQMESELRHRHPDWQQRMADWEATVSGEQPTWHVIEPAVDEDSSGGQKYLLQPDGSFLAQGYAPTKHTVVMRVDTPLEQITGLRLELMTDPNLPCRGPGRSTTGTAALTEITVQTAPRSEAAETTAPATPQDIKIASATASFNPAEQPLLPQFDDNSGQARVTGPIEFAFDGNGLTAWGTGAGPGRRNRAQEAVFQFDTPIAHPGGASLTIWLRQDHGGWNSDDNQSHNLGRFRLSVTTAQQPVADLVPAEVRSILRLPVEQRTAAQQLAVFSYWRTTVPEWSEENARIDELWRQHPEGSTQLVLEARDNPRPTHVLARGDFLQPTQPVEAGVPGFLHEMSEPSTPESAIPDRLRFARWLVDRDSPTVARAWVNRVWQAYFGTGLVETPEDLGLRGAAPSHPELLDWLAAEFMEHGWSNKELHRRIVLSATYQQSSHQSEELRQQDPYNRLLARGPRFRVDAELVRDIALSVSGLLNDQLGGPSVHPPLPAFMVQPPVSYGPKPWPVDEGPDRYRRAIYTFRFRSVPYPALEVFDAPNGDFSCVRRSRSNTPLQALVTLNETVFVECAQALAARMIQEAGPRQDDRIRYGFRLCLGRHPEPEELSELSGLLDRQRTHLRELADDEEWKTQLPDPATCPAPVKPEVSPSEYAAWTAVARVLLNLDETVTKE
jgi:hypothetical protein